MFGRWRAVSGLPACIFGTLLVRSREHGLINLKTAHHFTISPTLWVCADEVIEEIGGASDPHFVATAHSR